MDKKLIKKYAILTARVTGGALVYAVGFSFFCYPNAIVSGGVTGVAMILNMLMPELPVGVMIIVMNIPLFFVAWKKLGFDFLVASLLGMVISSLLVDLFNSFPLVATAEPLLGALYGGLIKGVGSGIIYAGGASFGGIDIMAKILRRRYPYINFGTFILALDGVILLIFALVFQKYDITMYSIICIYVVSRIIDLLLYGPVSARLCYIISEKSETVQKAITGELHRGVTMLRGVGAYSGKEKQVLMCVVKRQQIVEIRRLVKNIDKTAFIVVTDARDVYGNGFDSIEAIE